MRHAGIAALLSTLLALTAGCVTPTPTTTPTPTLSEDEVNGFVYAYLAEELNQISGDTTALMASLFESRKSWVTHYHGQGKWEVTGWGYGAALDVEKVAYLAASIPSDCNPPPPQPTPAVPPVYVTPTPLGMSIFQNPDFIEAIEAARVSQCVEDERELGTWSSIAKKFAAPSLETANIKATEYMMGEPYLCAGWPTNVGYSGVEVGIFNSFSSHSGVWFVFERTGVVTPTTDSVYAQALLVCFVWAR